MTEITGILDFDYPVVSGYDDVESDIITLLVEQGDIETLYELNKEMYVYC